MIQVLDNDGVDVVQLAAGDGYSCAISLDGYVMTWGENLCGQLGHGDLDTRCKSQHTLLLFSVCQRLPSLSPN